MLLILYCLTEPHDKASVFKKWAPKAKECWGHPALGLAGPFSRDISLWEEHEGSGVTTRAAQPTPALLLSALLWPDPSSLWGGGSEECLLVQSELDLQANSLQPELVVAEPSLLPAHMFSLAVSVFQSSYLDWNSLFRKHEVLGDVISGCVLGDYSTRFRCCNRLEVTCKKRIPLLFFFLPHCLACESLVPWQGCNLGPLQLECGV